MMLTEKQITFFEVFGFLKLPGLFAAEISKVTEIFNEVFRNYDDEVVHWVHAAHENNLRRFLPLASQKSDYIASLLEEPRIQNIAVSLLGDGYGFTGSDMSIYDCGTTFHQDGFDAKALKSRNIKMALYLDEVDETSGAIRVIPGSHHRGDKFFELLSKNWISPEILDLTTAEFPATVVPSSPGDLLLWDYRLMHGTVYCGNQRRMLAFEFAKRDAAES